KVVRANSESLKRSGFHAEKDISLAVGAGANPHAPIGGRVLFAAVPIAEQPRLFGDDVQAIAGLELSMLGAKFEIPFAVVEQVVGALGRSVDEVAAAEVRARFSREVANPEKHQKHQKAAKSPLGLEP